MSTRDLIPDLNSNRARALALMPVSRETLARLDRFVATLLKRRQTTNLIAASMVSFVWSSRSSIWPARVVWPLRVGSPK
jgi:16S rRNA (guanine527-N7)-methyltransferase